MTSPVIEKGYHAGREPSNKGRTLPPGVLTGDEALALIGACSNTSSTGIRNRALITVMYRGGLRLGEALALYPKDIDIETGTITVLHGKGDKRRVIGIDPTAVSVVARWLDRRRNLGIGPWAPWFCILEGGPLKPSYVRTLLPRLASKAGIEKRVHPHGLRHTHAYEVMMEGVPVPFIQQQLGHSSLETTSRYLSHLAPRDVIDRMRSREWSIEDT